MKNIMLATDFSARADRALRRATLLARQFGAALTVVHAIDDDLPQRIVESERTAVSDLLRELRSTIRDIDGVPCETRIVLADPFEGIPRAAEEGAADLIVVGAHRRQALRDIFVGTTAERTIRTATCPVLMVNAPPVGSYNHVMVASDLSEGAELAAKTCASLDIAKGAEVSFLHVFDAPALRLVMSSMMPAEQRRTYLGDQCTEASRGLSAFVKSAGWRSARETVREGKKPPADEILAAARENAADLVVVGTRGRSGIARFILGSVAEAVLRKAEFDVLAIPPAAVK